MDTHPPRVLFRLAGIVLLCLGLSAAAVCAAEGPSAGPRPAAPPALRTFALGRGDAGVPAEFAPDGACAVVGSGAQAGNGRDEATFTALETEAPAFTFVARVRKAEGFTATSKWGLAVRASQWGPDKAVFLGFDAQEDRRCLQWFMRFTSRMRDDEGGRRCFVDGLVKAMNRPEGFWLRLTRRFPVVEMAWSDDGKAWTAVPYRASLLAAKVLVGFQVTAGGDGKQPVTVTYDQVAFTVDDVADAETPARFADYAPPAAPVRCYLAKVAGGKAGPCSAFLLVPKGLDPARIRAILFTPGNKETLQAGNAPLPFDADKTLRKPKAMPDYEGACDLENLRPFYQALAAHGIVRLAGIFAAADYGKAVERLAAVSGLAHLPNIPVLAMGDALATGPARCIAGLGKPGADLQTTHLSVFNTADGGGLGAMLAAMPGIREKHGLWACAPQWTVGHKPSQGEALVFPFFLEVLRLRLPADADLTKGAPTLKPVPEADGWLGLADTWNGNCPQAVPWKDDPGKGNRVWLPSAAVARTWQATVANFPRVVIHYPTFDGNASFDAPLPEYWHNSILTADAPVPLVASGPTGADVKVEYFEGDRPLKVLRTHGSPYRVTLEGLTPGLHALHAVATVDGVCEYSHPVLVTVLARR